MTFDCHVARRALRKPPAKSSNANWISDAILAESIQRFTCLHRRHGSSVPGPLEARRRTTRRRKTSLVSVGGLGAPNDVEVLLRSGRRREWWNAPSSCGTQAGTAESSSLLPSWFTGLLPSPSLEFPPTVPLWPESTPTRQLLPDHFCSLLAKCQSLQDIRELVCRSEINILQKPGHSRLIAKHLLNSDWGPNEFHEFLLDRTLCTPGSGGFQELLEWLVSRSHSKEHLGGFYECIKKSLILGLLSAVEIQKLLTKLPTVKTELQGSIEKLGASEAIQEWYWMMADAMDKCPVFNLEDLAQKQLQQWCFCVSEAPFAPCAFDTFRATQRYLVTSTSYGLKVNIAQGLIRKWVTCSQRAQEHHWIHAEAGEFLAALPPAVAAKSICHVTEKLVRDVFRGSRQPTALETWMKILSCLSGVSADRILGQGAWTGSFSEGATATGLSSQQAIIIRLWTATQLTRGAPKAHRSKSLQHLTHRLVHILEGQLGPCRGLLAELLFMFQSLPLPSPSAVIQHIAMSSTGNLQFHGSVDKLRADMLTVSEAPVALFKEDDVYRNARYNLNDHVTEMAERATLNPEAFLQVAHALIMRDKLSTKIITRILRHNRAFNFSLIHAAEATQKHTTLGNSPSHSSDPTSSLHLLNALARSFAISPVLTPRQSFRKVYWIYLHLHRYTCGHAIGPEIIRALWHAGVTRYKETGTSPEKVGWILGKVREVEGHEVADSLLWFGAGGVRGWKEWMEKGCGGVDEEGWRRLVRKKKPHLGEATGGWLKHSGREASNGRAGEVEEGDE